MRVLLTGMNGFIGHHVAEVLLKETDWRLVGLDRIDATSTLHRLKEIDGWREFAPRVDFVWHDLRAPINNLVRKLIGKIDAIVHTAASTHVDRSIEHPVSFVMDNVLGTCHLLDYAKGLKQKRPLKSFIYFSTDEVFGPAPEGVAYKEWDRYRSGNPYAATKAGAEELCLAYHNTYGVPALVTHCMNVIGERQHPEKFVPMVVRLVRDQKTVTIHADKTRTRAGSRFYIHAHNVAAAVKFLLDRSFRARPDFFGDKFNIVGEKEVSNLELAQKIAEIVGKPLKYEMVDFHSSRPGHDLRYALDGSKLAEMGQKYPYSFEESLEEIVHWYLRNPQWLES